MADKVTSDDLEWARIWIEEYESDDPEEQAKIRRVAAYLRKAEARLLDAEVVQQVMTEHKVSRPVAQRAVKRWKERQRGR